MMLLATGRDVRARATGSAPAILIRQLLTPRRVEVKSGCSVVASKPLTSGNGEHSILVITALWRVTRAVLKWINNLPELVLGRWFWIPFLGFLLAGLVMPVMLIALSVVGARLTEWMVWAVILTCTTAVCAVSDRVAPTRRVGADRTRSR